MLGQVLAALPLVAGALARKFLKHCSEHYFFLLGWKPRQRGVQQPADYPKASPEERRGYSPGVGLCSLLLGLAAAIPVVPPGVGAGGGGQAADDTPFSALAAHCSSSLERVSAEEFKQYLKENKEPTALLEKQLVNSTAWSQMPF